MSQYASPSGWQQTGNSKQQRKPVSTTRTSPKYKSTKKCPSSLDLFCKKHNLQPHPLYYYAQELNKEEFPEYSEYDIEQWAITDWEEFDIWVENYVDFRLLEDFKRQWFIGFYGDTFRPYKVLNYDFKRYQENVIQHFMLGEPPSNSSDS